MIRGYHYFRNHPYGAVVILSYRCIICALGCPICSTYPLLDWGTFICENIPYLNSKAMNCCYSSRPPKSRRDMWRKGWRTVWRAVWRQHCDGGQNGDGRFDGGCDGKYDGPACVWLSVASTVKPSVTILTSVTMLSSNCPSNCPSSFPSHIPSRFWETTRALTLNLDKIYHLSAQFNDKILAISTPQKGCIFVNMSTSSKSPKSTTRWDPYWLKGLRMEFWNGL